jgi:hypothetical protein
MVWTHADHTKASSEILDQPRLFLFVPSLGLEKLLHGPS